MAVCSCGMNPHAKRCAVWDTAAGRKMAGPLHQVWRGRWFVVKDGMTQEVGDGWVTEPRPSREKKP